MEAINEAVKSACRSEELETLVLGVKVKEGEGVTGLGWEQENLNPYSKKNDIQEMSKRDETEASYFHENLLSFCENEERTESL